MRIDVVSDVVCPWCFIGKRQLEAAIAAWRQTHPDQPEPEVIWHPFQLNPRMPQEGVDRAEYLSRKFGTSDISRLYANVRAAAGEVELPLALERIGRMPSTLRPHALLAAALNAGGPALQAALAEALFAGYFQQGLDLSDNAVLAQLARDAGMPAQAIAEALEQPAIAEQVRQADAQARESGLGGVPYFVINGRVPVHGAQGRDTLLRALDRASRLEPAPFALEG